jgi:hypothetical protein
MAVLRSNDAIRDPKNKKWAFGIRRQIQSADDFPAGEVKKKPALIWLTPHIEALAGDTSFRKEQQRLQESPVDLCH